MGDQPAYAESRGPFLTCGQCSHTWPEPPRSAREGRQMRMHIRLHYLGHVAVVAVVAGAAGLLVGLIVRVIR